MKDSVNAFFEKENVIDNGGVRKVSVDDLCVNVVIEEKYCGEDMPKSFTYVAKIKYIFCNGEVSLTKVGEDMKKSSRWVLTNYRRHLGLCMKKKRKRSVTPDKSQPTLYEKLKRFKSGPPEARDSDIGNVII
uniref:Uncharacterized protein n=1 Tax=Bracon brevicornis TaxID=1563983 RepID=A0A6V7JGG6_9HYME